jgi:hypothetical protein
MELQIRSLKLSLHQISSYLQLLKGPQRKRLISGNMDGVRVGVMKVPYLQKYCKLEEGQSATDYESRAHIFGRSAELFGARKTENEDCRI